MKSSLFPVAVALVSLLVGVAAHAQTLPADAPAGSTVQCNDGSYAAPDTKSGACRGHKGIKNWYGKTAESRPAATATPAVPGPAVTGAPAASSAAASTAVKATNQKPAVPNTAAASGGGAGKVWVNDETKVYHCMGDRYYGKTKKGEYLSETDAKAKGMHASHGKACN